MPLTKTSKRNGAQQVDVGYRFGSIAEIRSKAAAIEILESLGGESGLAEVTMKIQMKARTVHRLRVQLAELMVKSERKPA
jgi:hypothetical protein